jgi:hypothetical protein
MKNVVLIMTSRINSTKIAAVLVNPTPKPAQLAPIPPPTTPMPVTSLTSK